MATKHDLCCLFCARGKPEAKLLVHGPVEGSCICDECVEAAAVLLIDAGWSPPDYWNKRQQKGLDRIERLVAKPYPCPKCGGDMDLVTLDHVVCEDCGHDLGGGDDQQKGLT